MAGKMSKCFLGLRSPQDLMEKLEYDFRYLKDSPDNQYLAFNFFVTAEHLPDWVGCLR